MQRHFARLELHTRPDGRPPRSFGRFEAEAANDRWTGDALHGPVVGGRKTYLFALIDDHSRALIGYRWVTVRTPSGSKPRCARALHPGGAKGRLRRQRLRVRVLAAAARAGQPGDRADALQAQPAGRGKIERFFRTVREQFLVELGVVGVTRAISDLAQLNELFAAWVETVYHLPVHSETGQPPLERFVAAGAPVLPTPAQLHEAFLWSAHRTVTKTATISLHGNSYEVDAALVGRRVEMVFDPFNLTQRQGRRQDRPAAGQAARRGLRHGPPPSCCPAPPSARPVSGRDEPERRPTGAGRLPGGAEREPAPPDPSRAGNQPPGQPAA